MFRRSLLMAKLTIAFLLTTSLVAGVSIYQMKTYDQANTELVRGISDNANRLVGLESIRSDIHEIGDLVSSFDSENPDVTVNVSARKQAIEESGKSIEEHKKAYLAVNSGGGIASPNSIMSIFEVADEVVRLALESAESPSGSAASAESVAAQVLELQESFDTRVHAQLEALRTVIGTDSALATEKTAQLTKANITIAIMAVGAAVILGLLFAGLLSRSIGKIQRGAERIANGDFSRPIEVKSRDEIGLLAESFNKMATRLRDSYARLAFERQRDETVLEGMSDGLIATDRDGTVVLINSTAVHLLHVTDRSSVVGKPVEDVLVLRPRNGGTDPVAIQERPEARAFALGRPAGDIFAYQKPSGEKILVSVGASPIVLEGKSTGTVMIIRDVTREQEVDRMKTEFISLASHQLRTPLSAIKWFSEMLVSGDAGKLTPEQEEFARNVADSTERMIALVNSLLNISRIESGRIMIDPKPTDLSQLVNGIVNDLKAKIEERHQTLVVSVHKELPKVNLDSRLVGQVYLNLLTNAIKYTPKGGEISVFVSRKDNELVSQVTDNGYGIPKSEQGKMFQKFFRATNISKIETDGTGLGMYLIKAIVESSGGKIWFESEEGKGTTFWFSLPMSGMKPKEGEVTLDA